MLSYPDAFPSVQSAKSRLRLVADFVTRDEDTTVATLAAGADCSVAQVYKLHDRLLQALLPRRPGPAPTPPPHTRIVLDPAPAPTPPDPRRAVLEMAVSNVSIRGIQRLLRAMGAPPMDRERIIELLRRAGRAARRLIGRAGAQLRDRLDCLAGDDIFFHRTDIKVLLEPVSGALLEVIRWPGREAEDWALFLEQWPALKLLVSDLGTDLVGAARLRAVAHQADLFHERAWWTKEVFTYLSRREQRRADEALAVWDRATRPVGPGRRASAQSVATADARRAEAEEDFYTAVRAEMLLVELFSPLAPDGRRWSDAQVEDHLTALRRELSLLPESCRARVSRHVERHRARWSAHRVLWDGIEVRRREGSDRSRDEVLDAVVSLWWSEHRVVTPGSPEAAEASRGAWRLRRSLEAECANVDAVLHAVTTLIERPHRSSSLVEALNSRLRVLQMVHRNVSDELLALVALRWNLSPKSEGRRRGPSPFAQLGVDFADDARPWYDVLLAEIDAN